MAEVELTKELAAKLVLEHSWPTERDKTAGTCPECGAGLGAHTRRVVHTMMSAFGADNDVVGVVAAIEHPDSTVMWAPRESLTFGHDLCVRFPTGHGERGFRVEVHHAPVQGCEPCHRAFAAVV